MLAESLIEPAQAGWAALTVIVLKKNGTLQFFVEYHKFNAVTSRYSYLITRMDECIDWAGEAAAISTLNANSENWQIVVSGSDMEETAYILHHGLHQFAKMRFALYIGSGTLQSTMDVMLSSVT